MHITNLTLSERRELEQLISQAWGDDYGQGVITALMLDVADVSKLAKALEERAHDLDKGGDDEEMSQLLRYFAAKITNRKPSNRALAAYNKRNALDLEMQTYRKMKENEARQRSGRPTSK